MQENIIINFYLLHNYAPELATAHGIMTVVYHYTQHNIIMSSAYVLIWYRDTKLPGVYTHVDPYRVLISLFT